MADEDDDDRDEGSEPEPERRFFTLTEAERARQELEPFLLEAIDCRKKLAGLETDLTAVATRITMMGGILVPYEKLATLRVEHQHLAETMKTALNRILETGCVIKDLEVGLLDFPAIIDNQEVGQRDDHPPTHRYRPRRAQYPRRHRRATTSSYSTQPRFSSIWKIYNPRRHCGRARSASEHARAGSITSPMKSISRTSFVS